MLYCDHMIAMVVEMAPSCKLQLLVFAVTIALARGILHVNPETRRIIDAEGKERYFHGVNVVVKGPPWIPEAATFDPRQSFVDKDMLTLQELGLNAIRLGMMWPGVEPQKGQYNYTYLKVARDITNKAIGYGIYSLLDMHQDTFSAKYCGEGVPDWAVYAGTARGFPFPLQLDPFPIDPKTGHPYQEDCQKFGWPDYQWTEAGAVGYQMIYNNTNGLLESWGGFWSTVADYFKDDDNILGYELMNEPWAGDFYADPGLIFPTIADKKNLQPAYDYLNKAIRAKDNQHSIYFESVTWDDLTNGFEHVPGGDEYRNRSVLSYHFYRPPNISPNLTFTGRMEDLKRLGCAGFLTEFGMGGDLSFEVFEEADLNLQSWTGWDYKPYYGITGDGGSLWFDNGTLNMPLAKALSRTYAQSVAGETQVMHYNYKTQEFTLVYATAKECTSTDTEIYLNEALHYPKGYTVTLVPSTSVTWKSGGTNKVVVEHQSTLPVGTKIQVTIKAK